ncbi:MAG: M15 family metallopeptidase [Clostridia bacterium]|nr:M15 family metallopeptidase [Clostridia bacterium]
MKKKNIIITIFIIISIILILWIIKEIPKFITKQVAINYTKNKEQQEVIKNEFDIKTNKNTINETTEEITNNTNTDTEKSDYELVKIIDYIPNIIIDLKYASTDNFTGVLIYNTNEAYLRYGTVKKLIKAQEELNKKGYNIVVWDAYRPVEAQFKLWEVCPNPTYVANPNKGYSSHSKGNTIDIGIVSINGNDVELPSGFDDFSKKADRDYSDVSKSAKINATMLENIMSICGFKGYSGEWWHYSDSTTYPVIK